MLAFQLIGLALLALFFGPLVTGKHTHRPLTAAAQRVSITLGPVFAGHRIAPQGRPLLAVADAHPRAPGGSSSSLTRRTSLTTQCTTMAPPAAASVHFTKGESRIGGMKLLGLWQHADDQSIRLNRGIFAASRSGNRHSP